MEDRFKGILEEKFKKHTLEYLPLDKEITEAVEEAFKEAGEKIRLKVLGFEGGDIVSILRDFAIFFYNLGLIKASERREEKDEKGGVKKGERKSSPLVSGKGSEVKRNNSS